MSRQTTHGLLQWAGTLAGIPVTTYAESVRNLLKNGKCTEPACSDSWYLTFKIKGIWRLSRSQYGSSSAWNVNFSHGNVSNKQNNLRSIVPA
jgi:hypothetical protein